MPRVFTIPIWPTANLASDSFLLRGIDDLKPNPAASFFARGEPLL